MTNLHFAQISDIHISQLGDYHDMLSGRSAEFLSGVIARLNRIDDLDFVLFSGDLFVTADNWELEQFQAVAGALKKPYHIIPGNHDRRDAHQTEGLTRHQFAQRFNPQVADRPGDPEAQNGYWSIEVADGVQLIGLDSNRDEDWGGIVDALQLVWLKDELAKNVKKLVMVTVHHPLHPMVPIDYDPFWRRFVCDTGPELLALLDENPQVKMVLTGHHHMTRVDRLGNRLHLACPALPIYPCAYRTLRLRKQQADGPWHLAWQTHSAVDAATVAEAQKAAMDSWNQIGFDSEFIESHLEFARGSDYDRNGTTEISTSAAVQIEKFETDER